MKYDPYSLTELIRNDDFIAWVLHPDAESEMQWQLFLVNHPDKKKTVASAREYVILLAADTGRNVPAPQQSEKMWRMVESSMQEETPNQIEPDVIPVVSNWRWVRVAASAALILSIGSVSYWFYYKGSDKGGSVASVGGGRGQTERIIQRYNDTDKPMMVLLPDESSVVLQPGAKLSFAGSRKQNRREVTLTGKAFFEIAKDPQKPFLVYSYGLTTKVLGTSFLIDASDRNKEIKVEVKTGMVTVFSVKNSSEKDKQFIIDDATRKGLVLTGNDKVLFSKEDGGIVKLPVEDKKQGPAQDAELLKFEYDEIPVREVFRQLETAYNVKILYDLASLGNFPLNATLTGKPFRSKLEVICKAINAEFTIDQNVVTIIENQ